MSQKKPKADLGGTSVSDEDHIGQLDYLRAIRQEEDDEFYRAELKAGRLNLLRDRNMDLVEAQQGNELPFKYYFSNYIEAALRVESLPLFKDEGFPNDPELIAKIKQEAIELMGTENNWTFEQHRHITHIVQGGSHPFAWAGVRAIDNLVGFWPSRLIPDRRCKITSRKEIFLVDSCGNPFVDVTAKPVSKPIHSPRTLMRMMLHPDGDDEGDDDDLLRRFTEAIENHNNNVGLEEAKDDMIGVTVHPRKDVLEIFATGEDGQELHKFATLMAIGGDGEVIDDFARLGFEDPDEKKMEDEPVPELVSPPLPDRGPSALVRKRSIVINIDKDPPKSPCQYEEGDEDDDGYDDCGYPPPPGYRGDDDDEKQEVALPLPRCIANEVRDTEMLS